MYEKLLFVSYLLAKLVFIYIVMFVSFKSWMILKVLWWCFFVFFFLNGFYLCKLIRFKLLITVKIWNQVCFWAWTVWTAVGIVTTSLKCHKLKFEVRLFNFLLVYISSEMQALEPVCITLGDQQTLWALDIHGNLWFRTGIVSKKPQGDDNHWWQVGTFLFCFQFSLTPRVYYLHCFPMRF